MREDFVAAVKATAQYKAKLSERKSKSGSVVQKPVSQPKLNESQPILPSSQPSQKVSSNSQNPVQEIAVVPAAVQPVPKPVAQP